MTTPTNDGEPVAADDRTVNGEGAPFGPILRDMLAVESDRLRASYTAEKRDEVLRLATILTMASDYIAAIVEGKGPRPTPPPGRVSIVGRGDEAERARNNKGDMK